VVARWSASIGPKDGVTYGEYRVGIVPLPRTGGAPAHSACNATRRRGNVSSYVDRHAATYLWLLVMLIHLTVQRRVNTAEFLLRARGGWPGDLDGKAAE